MDYIYLIEQEVSVAKTTTMYVPAKAQVIRDDIHSMLKQMDEDASKGDITLVALEDYQAKVKRKFNKKVGGE